MRTERLPKIALEEAYEHPDSVVRILASNEELARVSDGGGVTPEYNRPVQEKHPCVPLPYIAETAWSCRLLSPRIRESGST